MRARQQRKSRNRRILLVSVLVVVIAVIVVAFYAYYAMQSPEESLVGQPISTSLYNSLYKVAQTSYGSPNSTLLGYLKPTGATPFVSKGKPIVVYVGADYCPYCAFQRWPIIIALLRFGNFTNLSYMLSSSTDVYANSPTFSFYKSSYSSKYISFQGYEEADRNDNPLQTAPDNYSALFQQYGHGSFPFLDINNKFYVSGSFEFPTLLDGKDWSQIVSQLGGNNSLSEQVLGSANVITAAICNVTGGLPVSVCGMSSVSSLEVGLTSYVQSANATFAAGTMSEMPSTWATVQYRQIAWITNTSANTKYDTPNAASTQSGTRA